MANPLPTSLDVFSLMADKVFKALRRTVVKHNAKTQILSLTVCMWLHGLVGGQKVG